MKKKKANSLWLAMSILFLLGHCATMEQGEKMCGKKRKEQQQTATNLLYALYVAQEPLQILGGLWVVSESWRHMHGRNMLNYFIVVQSTDWLETWWLHWLWSPGTELLFQCASKGMTLSKLLKNWANASKCGQYGDLLQTCTAAPKQQTTAQRAYVECTLTPI